MGQTSCKDWLESSEGTEITIPCLKNGQISDVQTEKMEVGVSQAS